MFSDPSDHGRIDPLEFFSSPSFGARSDIQRSKGVRSFSVVYLAFIRATPPILLILFFYSLFPSLLNSFFKSIGSHFNVFEINPFTMPLSSLA